MVSWTGSQDRKRTLGEKVIKSALWLTALYRVDVLVWCLCHSHVRWRGQGQMTKCMWNSAAHLLLCCSPKMVSKWRVFLQKELRQHWESEISCSRTHLDMSQGWRILSYNFFNLLIHVPLTPRLQDTSSALWCLQSLSLCGCSRSVCRED